MMENRFLFKFKFEHDALEPQMSKNTINNHLTHLSKYATNLAMLITETKFEDKEVDEILLSFEDLDQYQLCGDPLYNNAAQVKNHHLFFEQLKPNKDKARKDSTENKQLEQMIIDQFGSLGEPFTKNILKAIHRSFGSGWIWVTLEQHRQWDAPKISIRFTPNGGTFITSEHDPHFIAPLLVIDVWEHAYYLDHQSDRESYFNDLWSIIDWSIIDTRFEVAIDKLFDYTKPFEH